MLTVLRSSLVNPLRRRSSFIGSAVAVETRFFDRRTDFAESFLILAENAETGCRRTYSPLPSPPQESTQNFLHICTAAAAAAAFLPLSPIYYSFPTHTTHFVQGVCVRTFDCFLPEISSCVCLEGTRCRAGWE